MNRFQCICKANTTTFKPSACNIGRYWSWLEMPPRIWRWSVSLQGIYSWPSVVTRSWTRLSKPPLPAEVSFICITRDFSSVVVLVLIFLSVFPCRCDSTHPQVSDWKEGPAENCIRCIDVRLCPCIVTAISIEKAVVFVLCFPILFGYVL